MLNGTKALSSLAKMLDDLYDHTQGKYETKDNPCYYEGFLDGLSTAQGIVEEVQDGYAVSRDNALALIKESEESLEQLSRSLDNAKHVLS